VPVTDLPDPRFIESPQLQNIFLDKDTAFPMSGGRVEFYEDNNRTVFKTIYQQVRQPNNTYLFVPLNNPVGLGNAGSYVDLTGNDINVYLYPYVGSPTDEDQGAIDLYYIKVYNADGVFQFDREAWPPNVQAVGGNTVFQDSDNQIENPQFVDVLFNNDRGATSHSFAVSGAGTRSSIIPDWDIITNGSGTVVVSQLALTDLTAASLPPYALRISSSGITSLQLRQRITASPRLMGASFISGSFVAKSFNANAVNLVMNYVASNGYTENLVNDFTSSDGNFNTLINDTATEINTTNTNAPPSGHIDIVITIPVGQDVGITSVQIVAVANIESTSEFLQESVPRQLDHLFHYYDPLLKFKPIPSYLVGWDFPLNPAQFGVTGTLGAIGANKGAYVWDQTIVFQAVDNSVSYSRDSSGSLQLAATANTQVAIIQYLDSIEAVKILINNLAVNVRCYSNVSANVTISLWYTTNASLPVVTAGTNNTFISTLDANGHPSAVVAGWTEVSRGALGSAAFTQSFSTFIDNGFSGWDLLPQATANTAKFFAIAIGTSTILSGNNIAFNSVSLVPGKIPTIPAPQTADEVLRECKYYYQSSYDLGVPPGTPGVYPNFNNAKSAPQLQLSTTITNAAGYLKSFELEYDTKRSVTPIIQFYSPESGTVDTMLYALNLAGVYPAVSAPPGLLAVNPGDITPSTSYTQFYLGDSRAFYQWTDTTLIMSSTAAISPTSDTFILYHFTCDARLGVV